MLNQLVEVITKTVAPNAADIDLCQKVFEPLRIAKNTVLEEQDKTPRYLYFIASGCMRLFYYDTNGDEVTTHLTPANNFIASFLSFIHEKPAKENIGCVTDCEVLRISRPELAQLIDRSENFKKFSLVIFEQAISATEKRANDLATLSAEQRYKKLIETQPALLQQVPVQYVASYLGIKPESLSRIRRQIIS